MGDNEVTGAPPRPWSYEIQYGPNGEEIYAWVYYHDLMVCTVKVHHAKMIVEAVNNHDRLTTENAELRRERDEARALVRLHHDWHLQSGIIGLQDGEGGWIEINNASEYSDSLMYERSQAFLENQPTEFKPMPRGGISAWWWQVAVLQRRQLRAAEARADALEKVLVSALAEHDHRKSMQVMLTEPKWVTEARAALAAKQKGTEG